MEYRFFSWNVDLCPGECANNRGITALVRNPRTENDHLKMDKAFAKPRFKPIALP